MPIPKNVRLAGTLEKTPTAKMMAIVGLLLSVRDISVNIHCAPGSSLEPIDDRVPFWGDSEFLQLTYPELKRSNYRVIVMTWGESIHYQTPSK